MRVSRITYVLQSIVFVMSVLSITVSCSEEGEKANADEAAKVMPQGGDLLVGYEEAELGASIVMGWRRLEGESAQEMLSMLISNTDVPANPIVRAVLGVDLIVVYVRDETGKILRVFSLRAQFDDDKQEFLGLAARTELVELAKSSGESFDEARAPNAPVRGVPHYIRFYRF